VKDKRKKYEPEEDYSRDIQVALSVSLAIFIFLFLTVRTLQVKPYKPKSEMPTIVEEVPPELEQIEEPPPPPKPKLVVEVEESEATEEEEEEVEFAPTTEFNEWETPPPPKGEEVYEFYAVEIKPVVIKFVEPVYPELARKAGIEGDVFVKALVDEEGNVIKTEVLKSSHPLFEKPALEAAAQFKFKPGYQRDRPVKVWVSIPFFFRLNQ